MTFQTIRRVLSAYAAVKDVEQTEGKASRRELLELLTELATVAHAESGGTTPLPPMPGLKPWRYDPQRRRWVDDS